MPAKKKVKHNDISFIDPVDEQYRFRRTMQKRGKGLHKKAMEVAIMSGGKVFLCVQIYDRTARRNTTLTFTSRGDRDWQKHARKLLVPEEDTIRLDTVAADYFPLYFPPKKPVVPKHSRTIKKPWFWLNSAAKILLPQLRDEFGAVSQSLASLLAQSRLEVQEYFGDDREELENSQSIEMPLNQEENAETAAVSYTPSHFRPVRPHWNHAETVGKEVRWNSWALLNELMRGRRAPLIGSDFFIL